MEGLVIEAITRPNCLKKATFEAINKINRLMYCWELENWPDFTFDRDATAPLLEKIRLSLGPLARTVQRLPEEDRRMYSIEIMIAEAKNTSSIEGEYFSREDLRSSIINMLALGGPAPVTKDKRVLGIGKLMRVVASDYTLPPTEAMLKYWHSILFAGNTSLRSIGDYRLGPEPMRIMSGPLLNPTIHYEAPPAKDLGREMSAFITSTHRAYSVDPVASGLLKAGVSHFYFESIHPFEDGNGRIGRALIYLQLSNTFGMSIPFSVSQALQLNQDEYYSALNGSRKTLDISLWMIFYLERILEAIDLAKDQAVFILKKTKLYDRIKLVINKNQEKALNTLFGAGPQGFEGGLSAKKYMRITRVSRATATRELAELTKLGALIKYGAGRSVRYRLNLETVDGE